MAKIKITQVRSAINRSKRQKAVLKSLGLKKLHQTVEHDDNPVIRGMVRKVEHMVNVEKA